MPRADTVNYPEHGLGNPARVDYASLAMRLLCLFLFALLVVPASLDAQAEKPVVRVTAVLDGPSPVFDQAIDNLSREIRSQLSDRYTVELVELTVPGDWTPQGVERQLDAAYSDADISVVFGFGHLTVWAVAKRKNLPKPTILPYVLEARSQGLPKRGDVSGRKNLSYITEDFDITDEADMLRKVAGSKRVVLLAEQSQEAVLSSVIQKEGLEVVVAEPSVEALIAAIPPTADGVVMTSKFFPVDTTWNVRHYSGGGVAELRSDVDDSFKILEDSIYPDDSGLIILGPMFAVTPEGGFACKYVNDTGADSVKGTVVEVSTAVDNAVSVEEADSD
ncbi:MAG: hypothetical protein JSU89_00425, partial [Myxococcales bacterium]